VRQVVGADLADPVVETVAVETGPADGWSGAPGPCRRHGGVITRNRRHQHRDRVRLRFRHQTQQRAPTRRQTQHVGQARARPSCQRQPDRLQHGAQHRTATRYGTVRPGLCSAKVRASHFLVVAEQPSNSKWNQRLAATDRRIIQPPLTDGPAPTWPRRMTRLPHVRSAPRRHRKSRVRVCVPPWPGIAVAQLRWWCTVSAASCACSLTS
jgi:hypothetical protein